MDKEKILKRISNEIIELWELSMNYDEDGRNHINTNLVELQNIANKVKENEDTDIKILKAIESELKQVFKRITKLKDALKLEIYQQTATK